MLWNNVGYRERERERDTERGRDSEKFLTAKADCTLLTLRINNVFELDSNRNCVEFPCCVGSTSAHSAWHGFPKVAEVNHLRLPQSFQGCCRNRLSIRAETGAQLSLQLLGKVSFLSG